MNERELEERLGAVAAAEARLHATLDSLGENDLASPSLLPGWSRGHVLAHVALNAHSLVNLFDWARTGRETPQYPSWEERDSDIRTYASRNKDEHRAALTAAGDAFAHAARALPLDRWDFPVAGIGGDPRAVETFLFGRLREVEIHHVDLAAGYTPNHWSEGFVRTVLAQVPARLGPRVDAPFSVRAPGVELVVGDGRPRGHVAGPGGELLAWLLGRSDGSGLTTDLDTLPRVPSWG